MNKNKAIQLLPQAFALHQHGKLDEAESVYRKALAADPQNADVLRMFGLLQLQRGRWEEGARLSGASLNSQPNQPEVLNNRGYALQNLDRNEEALACYDKAIELNPGYAGAWYNRGNTLQKMKRYDAAVSSYRQALAIRPGHADTCVNLGNALKLLERYDEARSCYEQALSLVPGHAVAHNNLGNTLKQLMHPDEALASFKRAIALDPRYADAYFNAAIVLQDMKRHDEALSFYQKSIALRPEHAEAHLNLGIVFKALKKYEDSLVSYQKALSLKPDYATAYRNQGDILQKLMRNEEALASYDRAIALSPEFAEAYNSRGLLYMELGRKAEAISSLQDAIKVDPNSALAYHNLVVQDYFGHAEQLASLYVRRSSLSVSDQVYLAFAMGKTLENAGRYDEAFDAYAEGNRLYHAEHPFDEAAEDKALQECISSFTRDLFEKSARTADSLPPIADERVPVFIVGMPRSGTTLIEQILASHSSLFGAGELTTLGEICGTIRLPSPNSSDWDKSLRYLRQKGQEYLDRIWELAPGARYITDKMPQNFLHLGLIHLMLPDARIIHSMRDPMDSCFSCYTQRFTEGHHYSYDLGALGRDYLRYAKLMAHWHSVLPPGRILDVRYEDNVADPEREARRLLDYLGLPWDPACLKFYENKRAVRTASLNQVRQPIYSSSVARWKKFEKHLGPLLEIVGTPT